MLTRTMRFQDMPYGTRGNTSLKKSLIRRLYSIITQLLRIKDYSKSRSLPHLPPSFPSFPLNPTKPAVNQRCISVITDDYMLKHGYPGSFSSLCSILVVAMSANDGFEEPMG